MYCPICRIDCGEGLNRCARCDADLVRDRPAEPEPGPAGRVTNFGGAADMPEEERTPVERIRTVSWSNVALRSAVEPSVWPGFLHESEKQLPTGYLAQRETGAQLDGV